MDKKKIKASPLARFRGFIQAGATLLTNHPPAQLCQRNAVSGQWQIRLRTGAELLFLPGRCRCLPGGSVSGGDRLFQIPLFLLHHRHPHPLSGCCWGGSSAAFLCPFGWFQELLHKIPSPKLSTKKLKPLRYLKYAVLLVMVVLLPLLAVNELGMGDPFFCKYLCPQGVLEGAIPLSLTNAGIRAALGKLFTWKACILLAVIVGSVVFYRPFCKWLCPLGAFYALLNKVSLFQMRVDTHKCVSCGACAKACKMDVDITKTPNHAECIRCGMCMKACPTDAIQYKFGLGDKSNTETTKE